MKMPNAADAIKQQGGRHMLTVFIALVAGMVLILIGTGLISSGKAIPFVDADGQELTGSVSEKVFLSIGGVRQGMFIKGKNKHNPVLLYLHGGLPDYHLTRKYPTGLEDYFTVVWWEQRGFGLSFSPDMPADSRGLDQLKSDAIAITNYLCQRFGQEKIYLMGRSGGSFVGIQLAAESPERYHAYIGQGQISDQMQSERLAYTWMLNTYKASGDLKTVRKLETAIITDHIPYNYLQMRDKLMHRLGVGTTRDMHSVVSGMFLPSLSCREYTLREKINLWRGKALTGVHPLWDTILVTDLTKKVNQLSIPVYFFHGIHDYTVSYALAKQFFNGIAAPIKGFYTFEQSAHSPMFEEPERMHRVMTEDVLRNRNDLADKQ